MTIYKWKRVTVRRRLRKANATIADAKANYAATLADIQANCPHDWKWYADPAGGTDSGYCCDLCNLWAKRKPEGTAR